MKEKKETRETEMEEVDSGKGQRKEGKKKGG